MECDFSGKVQFPTSLLNGEGIHLQVQAPLESKRRVIDTAHQIDGPIPIEGKLGTPLLLGQEPNRTHQEREYQAGIKEAESAKFSQWSIL